MQINRLISFFTVVLCLMTSCRQGWMSTVMQEEPPFGAYQDSLDNERIGQAIRQMVEADDSKQAVDKAVKHLYDSLGTMMWISEDGVSEDVREVVDHLEKELPQSGLNAKAFLLEDIRNDMAVVSKLAFDSLGLDINEVLPRLDYNITKAYARYAAGQRWGFVRPYRLLNNLYYREDRGYYAHLFDYEVAAPDYEKVVWSVCGSDRVAYLVESVPANARVYKGLQTQLRTATDSANRRRVCVNMERCRWQIKHPQEKERCVLVNLPSQQLWARGGAGQTSMKICCGAWNTKTPLLCSEISYMQVNPEWSLPPKIVESDFKRHVGDSAWFARHGYFVVSRKTGDTLNIAHIGHDGLRNQGLRFVQRGGRGNSLGRIVFRFASSFSIYLHDTNTPWVFERDRRTVSHGCIRVERPFDLARYFIPGADAWTLDKIRISMDIPPETERGRQWLKKNSHRARPFRLISYYPIRPKVPVYIVYYTMYPNPDTGVVETWPDIYGYDKPLAAAMGEYFTY